jgi:hypothetical protein
MTFRATTRPSPGLLGLEDRAHPAVPETLQQLVLAEEELRAARQKLLGLPAGEPPLLHDPLGDDAGLVADGRQLRGDPQLLRGEQVAPLEGVQEFRRRAEGHFRSPVDSM